MKPITLKDIAERAGVSVATVSLALRGRGEISRQRSEEIQALAKEMGYRPNPLLASLASKHFSQSLDQQGTPIAILRFASVPGREVSDETKYKDTLIEEARSLGYAPSSYSLPMEQSAKSLFRQLYHQGVQGIILVGSIDHDYLGSEVDWRSFSVVRCARFLMTAPFHSVRSNIFQSIKLAFNQLRERGYQRIGFALCRHEQILEDDEDRYGTALSLEMTHLPKRDQIPPYLGMVSDRKAFLKWFEKYKPEVVIGFSVVQYWYLRDAGIRIPEDVGFAGLHITEENIDIAGLFQNNDEIARQSIQFLDQQIRNHERGTVEQPMNLLIPSTWNEGKTLRSVKA